MTEVTVTIKPSGEPWVVFHAETPADAVFAIDDSVEAGLYEAVGRATEALRTRTLLGQQLGATPIATYPNAPLPQQYAQPAAPVQYVQPAPQYAAPASVAIPQLPPGEPEFKPCPHGQKQWKAGISKQNKPYGGWMCPATDRSQQCPPEYPRR